MPYQHHLKVIMTGDTLEQFRRQQQQLGVALPDATVNEAGYYEEAPNPDDGFVTISPDAIPPDRFQATQQAIITVYGQTKGELATRFQDIADAVNSVVTDRLPADQYPIRYQTESIEYARQPRQEGEWRLVAREVVPD